MRVRRRAPAGDKDATGLGMGTAVALSTRVHIALMGCVLLSLGVNSLVISAEVSPPEILDVTVPKNIIVCDNVTLVCQVRPASARVWWVSGGKKFTESNARISVDSSTDENGETVNASLHFSCAQATDVGNYTCFATVATEGEAPLSSRTVVLDVGVPAEIVSTKVGRAKEGSEEVLSCSIRGHPLGPIAWQKGNDTQSPEKLKEFVETKLLNDSFAETTLKLQDLARKDNGTYYCKAGGPSGEASAPVPLYVLGTPLVNIDFIKAVGSTRIFLNWTVSDGNEPVQQYFMQHMKNGTGSWTHYNEYVGGGNTSHVMSHLEPNASYKLRLSAKNAIGVGNTYELPNWVTTLSTDPVFTPNVTVKGSTPDSISIGWTLAPMSVREHIHYYTLVLSNNKTRREAIHPANSYMNVFMFTGLEPATLYHFKVAACSEFTKQCNAWSELVPGETMDGLASPPENVTVTCKFDNVSYASFVMVSWAPPSHPNGQIVHYNVHLIGEAKFLNESGLPETMTWGPKVKTIDATMRSARFDVVPPNTNYTVSVSGVTRSRGGGGEATRHCMTPPTIPDKDKLARITWGKIEDHGRWMFKLYIPRLSERNGPICCYRVFVVKLEPHQGISDLPSPEDFPISTYQEIERSGRGGAYVAEMFENVPASTEVIVGDGRLAETNNTGRCRKCSGVRRRVLLRPPATPRPAESETPPLAYIPSLMSTTQDPSAETTSTSTSTSTPAVNGLRRRRSNNDIVAEEPGAEVATPPVVFLESNDTLPVYDGQLDMNSNYTGFVEVIGCVVVEGSPEATTQYLPVTSPGQTVAFAAESNTIVTILQVLCALMLVILVILTALCLLQRYTKQVAESQGVEMNLRTSFRHLYRSLRGRHVLVSQQPPDMTPIAASDLPSAYAERHKDSDYGFQHEFEMLPDRFPDRTTSASETRENIYKNRYPDIKAYDQTRVKLAQVDSIIGSDYINANFVVGYKERKKFICAQGPMEDTVSDFWRMIWEQHLELVLMLTNLEEYSKTKCAKYWPDSSESKSFGDITVTHTNEKKCSDYILRELKMTRGSGSETRKIVQYHFLVWKDFQAPEYPAGILKFIRRMNEAYSLEKGPILVHCSAGVGRTGTLVALDSLLQQLAEEKQVAIFNTVCDLRHQRNFLVQSLKQYIFVYRALVDVAQFGDTELSLSRLKTSIEKLRQRENGQTKTKMEEEFDKICALAEERKTTNFGSAEEHSGKNRSESMIPYDRNRVILSPLASKEHATYINASFVEGYDNTESYIIAQDPLETTCADFWRMLSEQCISTLVMLSDKRPTSEENNSGDNSRKCFRYWPEPDDETMYDHIRVRYIQSESCPYYTRREFSVTNTKNNESTSVTQFQYHGWPTVEGQVPEVTRGLIELADQAQSHQTTQQTSEGTTGPIVVHCMTGSDRSSMFVALSILIQQLRTEKKIDVCTVSRKLRSQRPGMLQTFGQYEFLHRAIVNYADLHKLTESECNGTT
ncbi:hypothetical protein ONE63_008902 [Megalurothrips usitatus]|uniref:protein-tyrosine-phosphatase n=1 Tax=Megalurothrips usitatus TaxID=439358 RepID=A0AAV7XLK2_9NEOP|nr:hypothetical protein ONE63_008902 [Megalurothrips usitatus]